MSPQRNPTVGELLRPLVDVTDRGVRDGDSFTSWHDHIAAAAEIASALRARLNPDRPAHVGVLLGNTPFFSNLVTVMVLRPKASATASTLRYSRPPLKVLCAPAMESG